MGVLLLLATDGRSYLNTQSDYMPSPNAPRPHKQTTLSTTNTRNGPVAPHRGLYLTKHFISIEP